MQNTEAVEQHGHTGDEIERVKEKYREAEERFEESLENGGTSAPLTFEELQELIAEIRY